METNWSNILNTVVDIKNKYINKFGTISYCDSSGLTCVEKWILDLDDEEYTKMFAPIQFNQKNNLVLIRYGRYSSVFAGEDALDYDEFWNSYSNLYRECRSIVIDIDKEEVVISPFDKFFNINENEENFIEVIIEKLKNAKTIEITEKLDGSMQCARFYNNEIVMSGSQSLDENNSWRLKDGLRMLTSNENYVKVVTENSELTFIFEYISLADSHVVNYTAEQEGLYLIGLRNSLTGEQYSYSKVKEFSTIYGLKSTNVFENKTIEDIMNELDDKKSNEAEGFVINIDGFMCKIKYNDYTSIHKILSNISSINLIIKNIAEDTYDDLISKVPQAYRWRVERIANIVFEYLKITEEVNNKNYEAFKNLPYREAIDYINNNLTKSEKGFAFNMLKGCKNNYLKSKSGRYTKLNEMGYSENEYGNLFKNID